MWVITYVPRGFQVTRESKGLGIIFFTSGYHSYLLDKCVKRFLCYVFSYYCTPLTSDKQLKYMTLLLHGHYSYHIGSSLGRSSKLNFPDVSFRLKHLDNIFYMKVPCPSICVWMSCILSYVLTAQLGIQVPHLRTLDWRCSNTKNFLSEPIDPWLKQVFPNIREYAIALNHYIKRKFQLV